LDVTPEQIQLQQQQELLSQELPERKELNPEQAPLEKVPLFGSFFKGFGVLGRKVKESLGVRNI